METKIIKARNPRPLSFVVQQMMRLVDQMLAKPHLARRNRDRLNAQIEVLTSKGVHEFFGELERRGLKVSRILQHPEDRP